MVFILRMFLRWSLAVSSNSLHRALRARGLRLTEARRAVLQIVSTSAVHLPVAEVHRRALRVAPGIGLASVYRTIDLLNRLGLIKRVHVDDRHRHYAAATEGHGHHLVCRACGRVVEFSECQVEAIVKVLARRTRFVIEGHSIELYGRCPDCRPSNRRPNPRPAPHKNANVGVCRV